MTVAAAHRVRRAVLLLFATGATIGAHAIGTGGVHLTGRTGLFVASLATVAAVAPVRGPVFAPRGPLLAAAVLLAAQLVSHGVLSLAPNVVGLDATHATHSSWTASAVGVHVVLAVQLGLLMAFADRLLAALIRVVHVARAYVARLALGPSGSAPRVTVTVAGSSACSVARQPRRGRGPPLWAPLAHVAATAAGWQRVFAAPC